MIITFFKLIIFNKKNKSAGHGKRRRRRSINENSTTTDYTKFKENIEYTVIMPGEYSNNGVPLDTSDQCKNFVLISALLSILLALSTIIVSIINFYKFFK